MKMKDIKKLDKHMKKQFYDGRIQSKEYEKWMLFSENFHLYEEKTTEVLKLNNK